MSLSAKKSKVGSFRLEKRFIGMEVNTREKLEKCGEIKNFFSKKFIGMEQRTRMEVPRGLQTSRDRPKSAPYPRLKNSKKTSKCQVFFYRSRKSKIFRNFFFEKITY